MFVLMDDLGLIAVAHFELRNFGSCVQYITSFDECNEAAKRSSSVADIIAMDDRVRSEVRSDRTSDPPGCYFKDGKLKINLDGLNTGPCSPLAKCFCALPTGTVELIRLKKC